MEKLIKIHPLDNVLILTAQVMPGEHLTIHDNEISITQHIGIGHKMAAQEIEAGEKIIKYGVPIGSATKKIFTGEHIHLHNMKSDYIPTYTIEAQFKEKNN
jgi:(2R)-sulfolactate sulfo-lyase subunit alpha